MPFGKLLRKYIDNSYLSISKFASMIGVHRATLYTVFNEKSKLKQSDFEKILSLNIFSSEQKRALREAYTNETYSPEMTERILFIKSMFEELDMPPVVRTAKNFKPSGEMQSISGADKIVSAIAFIFKEELKKPSPRIMTNFSFVHRKLSLHVYKLLSEHKKTIDFRHVIRFEKNDEKADNLSSFLFALKFARLGYNTNTLSASQQEPGMDIILPYYFIGSSYMITFNALEHTALFTENRSAIKASAQLFDLVFSKSKPLAYFSKNELDFRMRFESVIKKGEAFTLSSHPCLCPLADESILEEILREELPNRAILLAAAVNHCKLLADTPSIDYISAKGFLNFMESGRCYDASKKVIKNFSPQTICKILKKQLEVQSRNSENRLYILNDARFQLPHGLNISCYSDVISVLSIIPNKGDDIFIGNIFLEITDSQAMSDIKSFLYHLQENGFNMNEESTAFFLKDLISQCKAKNKILPPPATKANDRFSVRS